MIPLKKTRGIYTWIGYIDPYYYFICPCGNMSLLLLLKVIILLLGVPQAFASEICYSRICKYDLVISAQESHVYRPADFVGPGTFDVDIDGQDLRVVNSSFRPTEIWPNVIGQVVPNPLDVMTLDGIKRVVITVNGQFPGPTLEVMEGAQVSLFQLS